MDTKNNQKLQHIFILLAVLALLISMIGCASEKKPRVKRSDASSDETVGEEPSKDVVVVQNNPTPTNPTPTNSANSSTTSTSPQNSPSTSSPKTPANVFQGVWDVDANGTFGNWNFNYASKNVDKLEGKITDGAGSIIGNYTVFPNNTVEINVGSVSLIVPYKVSNGGNKIEISDANSKVILTKGNSNSTIQNDGITLNSKGGWSNVTDPNDILSFTSVKKSSAGWTGAYARGTDHGTFSMKPGKITFTSQQNGSVDTFSYKLRNNNVLDLTDSKGNTESFN